MHSQPSSSLDGNGTTSGSSVEKDYGELFLLAGRSSSVTLVRYQRFAHLKCFNRLNIISSDWQGGTKIWW